MNIQSEEFLPETTIYLVVILNDGIKKMSVDKHFGKVITEVERVDPKEII